MFCATIKLKVSAYGLQAAWLAKFWRNELVDQAKLCDRAQQETEVLL
jgi:hypothetical protein